MALSVIDDMGVPLGVYEIKGQMRNAQSAKDTWTSGLIWALIVLTGAGAAGFILWKRSVIRKP